MSADHFLAEKIITESDPVLRFYGWNPFCLSLGKHQKTSDILFDQINKIDIVRRPTGGSAIYHSRELTYSFFISKQYTSHQEIYSFINYLLAKALINLGYKVILSEKHTDAGYLNSDDTTFACFNRSAKWEINYKNKKVVGSAQRIYQNSILQHGSILIRNDQEKMIDLLSLSKVEKIKQVKHIRDKSICLEDIQSQKYSVYTLMEEIIKQFNEIGKNIYYQYFNTNEIESIKHYYKNFRVNF